MGTWKDNWNTKDKAINSSVKTLGALSNIGLSAYNMATPDTEDMLDAVNNEIQSRNTLRFNTKSFDDLMSQWSAYKPLETSFNKDDYYVGPSTGDILKNTLNSTISGATTGATAGPWGALIGGVVGLGSGLIGGFIGKSKAEEAAEEAVRKKEQEARNVNAFQQASLNLNANNLKTQQRNMLDAQYAAFGGSLGGYGTDWSNGLTFIDNGGTHGQNPLGGVPMGMDKEGIPNLVEEGEVIWNDYVFSNRLKVPNAIRSKYKLKENLTFAQAVTKIQKASAERPNDPIEKRGLEDVLNDLMQEQEMVRQKKAEKEQRKNVNTLGGKLFARGGSTDDYWWADEYDKKRNSNSNNKDDNDNTFKFDPVLLRYAPILGSVIGVGTNLFNRPDYKYANELDKAAQTAANSIPRVSATALGDYMTYNPFDRMFYANELGAQAAANRRAIQNMSNGNRATAVANLLAADYNNNIGLGKLYRQGEEYNLAQRQAVSEFNRATNQYNAEADLKAQMANAELDQAKANMLLNSKMKSLGMRQADDNLWDANMAANLTNLFDNIGNIGWEEFNKNMINSNKGLKYYLDWLGNTQYKSGKNGGYLTIKNRRKK